MKAAVSLFAAVTLALAQSPITREGSDWVQVTSGTLPAHPSGKLHVLTEGNLVLQGHDNGARITYSLRRSVRAASLGAAERLLRDFDIRTPVGGSLASIAVLAPRGGSIQSIDLQLSVPRSLQVAILETRGGNISVSGIDGEVRAETSAGQLTLDRVGAAPSLRTGGGEVRVGRVAGTVRCYSGGGNIRVENVGRESWFETAGGDIHIREGGGTLHASTAGGNIRVDRCSGEVFAHTAAGVIDVLQAGGRVTADNSGGAIQVNAAHGVRCESAAGAIRLRQAGGGALRATTALGNILAELLAGARIEDSLLSTSAGDITVFLSSNIPLTVQARNESSGGRRGIISDFPEIRVRMPGVSGALPLLAEGALNGGGPVLRIYASGGTIYLRRQK